MGKHKMKQDIWKHIHSQKEDGSFPERKNIHNQKEDGYYPAWVWWVVIGGAVLLLLLQNGFYFNVHAKNSLIKRDYRKLSYY
jgi:hypothetical protein